MPKLAALVDACDAALTSSPDRDSDALRRPVRAVLKAIEAVDANNETKAKAVAKKLPKEKK